MYWYNTVLILRKIPVAFGLSCLTFITPSCRPDNVKSSGKAAYFDIRGFFIADSARLARKNALVTKTVTHNGIAQTRQVHISNWGNELRLFTQSDINKPAWRTSYKVVSSGDLLLYQAKYPDLITRQIIIKKENGKVKWLTIYNHNKNLLYESREQLSYFPDSVYTILRRQTVRITGTNVYKITGVINQ